MAKIAASNAKLETLRLVLDSNLRRVVTADSAPSQPVLSDMRGTYVGVSKM